MSSSGTPATDKPITSRRLTVILAVVCALSVIGAAAQAQSVTRSQNFKEKQTIDEENPCNFRLMHGEGTLHTQVIQNSSGDNTFKQHLNGQTVEVADATQRYEYQSWNTFRVRSSSDDFSFTVATRKHVIHQGQRQSELDGSYFDWLETTTHASGDFTVKKSRLECKRK